MYLAFINKIKMKGRGAKKLLFLNNTEKKPRNKVILMLRHEQFSKVIHISLVLLL